MSERKTTVMLAVDVKSIHYYYTVAKRGTKYPVYFELFKMLMDL